MAEIQKQKQEIRLKRKRKKRNDKRMTYSWTFAVQPIKGTFQQQTHTRREPEFGILKWLRKDLRQAFNLSKIQSFHYWKLKLEHQFSFEKWVPNDTPCLHCLLLSTYFSLHICWRANFNLFSICYHLNLECWNSQRRLLLHSFFYIRILMTVWNYLNSCKWLTAANTYH